MGKRILFYGFASGIALILMFILFFAVIENVCENYGVIPMWGYGLVALAFLVAIPAAYRHTKRRRRRSFGSAFGVALAVCAIAGLVFSVYAYIQFSTPEVEADEVYTGCEMLTFEYQNMGKEGMGLEILRLASFNINYGEPMAQTAILFLTIMIIGVLMSLLAASVALTINHPLHHSGNK